jgi:hypothetical protein
MDKQLLLFIVPGFITYKVFINFTKGLPNHTGGWDFVMAVLPLSYICEMIARRYYNFSMENNLYTVTSNNIIAYVVTPLIVGLILAFAYQYLIEREIVKSPFDLLTRECRNLFNKGVMLTMKNRKVYIGLLIDFDFGYEGSDQKNRVIQILPLRSGYRTEEDLSVEYNVRYDNPRLKKDVDHIFLPLDEVDSIRPYNKRLFRHFQSKKQSSAQKSSK